MGPLVQNFKLLVAHPVDEFRMRQQQREQPLGQRWHGSAALITTHLIVTTPAPFALALLAALPAGLPPLPVALAPGGAGAPRGRRVPRTGGLAVIVEPNRLVIEVRRRHIVEIGATLSAYVCPPAGRRRNRLDSGGSPSGGRPIRPRW